MIPDQIGQIRTLDLTAHIRQMIKAFITFRMRRRFRLRQQGVVFHRYERRVNHFIFGVTGMHASSADLHLRRSRIKVFIFQFSERAAVHRIRTVRIK